MRDCSAKRIGKEIWITNGEVELKHDKNDEIPSGFSIGRVRAFFSGKTHTEESKEKIRRKISGDICYNNGVINIKLKDGDTIPDGFKKGMIQVHEKFKWINDEKEERKFFFEKEDNLPEGWNIGRLYRKRKRT